MTSMNARYHELSPAEALQGAKKGNHTQRQQLLEAMKIAEAMTLVEKGPHRRSWGGANEPSSDLAPKRNADSSKSLGWFQDDWALWPGLRDGFKIKSVDGDAEKYVQSLAGPTPSCSTHMGTTTSTPSLLTTAVAERPPRNSRAKGGSSISVPKGIDRTARAWYAPLSRLCISNRSVAGAASIAASIAEVSTVSV